MNEMFTAVFLRLQVCACERGCTILCMFCGIAFILFEWLQRYNIDRNKGEA